MTSTLTRARGFSLTELLVAMVIGLLLLGGLVTLMVNSKKNYTQQDYNARLQENARFAMQFLSYDIRMAGYFGCSSHIVNDPGSTIVPIDATEGGSGASDTITIAYVDARDPGQESVVDAGYYPAGSTSVTLDLNQVSGDWNDSSGNRDAVIISDCGSAAIADIDAGGIDSTNDTLTVTPRNGGFNRVFDTESGKGGPIKVRRFRCVHYRIADGTSGIPTLRRAVTRSCDSTVTSDDPAPGDFSDLVEGVENIQLLFQALSGGNFVNAGSAPAQVAAVQLGALVRSISSDRLEDNPDREFGSGTDLSKDDGQYTMLGTNVSEGTIRGQRRVFSSTLAVRNRPL